MGEEKEPHLTLRSPRLERKFRKLFAAGYEVTSPDDPTYNCIAWAAHDMQHRWWPDNPNMYWPHWMGRIVKPKSTIECFVQSFHLLGYVTCGDSRLERRYEKVALYAVGDSPKHMARQLPDGNWTSKLGIFGEDITHYTLDAIEEYGPEPIYAEYGAPVAFMKRHVIVSWVVRRIQSLLWKLES